MKGKRLRFSEPVVVTRSEAGETRWGYHQFPALTRLPDGRILLSYANAEDASESHGLRAPAFVSDNGREWIPHSAEPRCVRPHFSISPLGDGDYLTCAAEAYFDVVLGRPKADADSTRFGKTAGDTADHSRTTSSATEAEIAALLPDPAAIADVYGTLFTYRCSELPEPIRRDLGVLPAKRFEAKSGAWRSDHIDYDMNDRLAWRRAGSTLLPRPFFERSLVSYHDELFYPDYRVRFALPDGRIPPKGCTWLMVSSDGGRTFRRRSLVAADPSGHDLHGEPVLAMTSDDSLVCVVRRADHVQKPMSITWSRDAGRTWTPTLDLFSYGVFPCLLRLKCGALLLSFGRPGVHVAVSQDGLGMVWEEVETIVRGDHTQVQLHTCGYTSLLEIDENRALIAYSEFYAASQACDARKTICVREVEVE